MSPADKTKRIVCDDLDSPLVESVALYAAWGYRQLYDELANDPLLNYEQRLEAFARGRASAMSKALVRAAQKHGVPYDLKRLDCNGQSKLLVKAGRVIVMQEPMAALYGDKPKVAAYKKEISRCAGVITQLELDLGDRPPQLLDWSDGVLAIVLHGTCGPRFSEQECELGALMLGIPDAAYENWTMRLDLHDLALFGHTKPNEQETPYDDLQQEDRVIVKRRPNRTVLRSNG